MVAAAASNRLVGKGTDSVVDCVADAQCAVGWLRARSDVDPGRVAAGGHSAGGQLALTVALLPDVSSRPDAVVVTAPPS